ncbi:MAG: TonB-dependent receptor [Gemmatimonadetes bacterium]|nr:TonB-dependent receptor [Gemmatimonadota bacterium]
MPGWKVLLLSLWGSAAAAGASSLAAQAAVSGTVSDSKTGRPLAEAVVTAVTGGQQARTNARGEFRLEGAASGQIRITRVGYQPTTVSATAGTPVAVLLVELVVKLDELVVTGTIGEAQQRSLGNAIGRISVADNVIVAPPAKLQDMLSVNVPGVRVIRASGAIGAGGTTRIRGSGSISLTNEPLIYVDGVRINNAAAVYSEAFQGQESPSRINDLNPEEIESIEVLKGPSAATIYGTEASNGVIQIITKKGKGGRPVYDVHLDAGANWLSNPEGRYEPNYYYSQRDKAVKEFRVLEFNRLRGFPSPFSTGTPLAMGASLSGGNDQLRYFFSADFNRDEGYVDYNWQNKYAGRANLSYTTTNNKFKVDFSMGTTRSRLRGASGFQPITTSILWACNFPGCEPNYAGDSTNTGWNGPGHGYQFYRPEDYYLVEAFDNVDRTTASVKLTHRPYSWLRHTLTIGPDFTNNKSSNLVEKDPTGYNAFFDRAPGYKAAAQNRSTFLTIDYGASADWNLSKSLIATSAVGVQYYYKQFDFLRATGTGFAVPGPDRIDGAAQKTAQEAFLENKTFGVYLQQQLAIKNRLFLTAAVRGDGNSAFGEDFDAAYYPKLSASWVLSEEPFLANSSLFSQLKVRAAWGKAGQQPDIFSAARTYEGKVGPRGLGGVTPQNLGNAGLKPEVGTEFEAGFDAGLFNQRVGVEFTWYNKDVNDAILSIPNKPSRGFPGFQFLNLGKVRNRGFELAVDGQPINGKNVGLDLRFTIATNDSKILTMNGEGPFFVGGSFIQQWNVEGYAPSGFWYRDVTGSTVRTFDFGIPLPLGTNPRCQGGTPIPRSSLGIANGSDVACAEAPAVYKGRPTPSWNGGFSATLTLGKRLRILGLLDYLGGNTVLVGDVTAIHTFFLSSKQVLEGTDPILSGYLGNFFLNGDANSIGAVGLFKGGFMKLRTISATYDLPDKLTRWVGASRGTLTVAGENLATLWREQKQAFGVTWIDPEIVPNRSNDAVGNFGYTQESWPQAARIRTTVRLTF